jgi:hypothetical protein
MHFYDIHNKIQYLLSFIYRYSQMLNVVSSCHAADVPTVRDFVQNRTNHNRLTATASVILARSSSKLAARGGTKLCLQRIPIQKIPEVLNEDVAVPKLSFHDI